MKNYFTIILYFLVASGLFAQTEPIEKVELEPDPVIMDAYDFATGRMNDVKWMVKGIFDNGPRIGFEYKLSKSISLNIQSAWLPSYFISGGSQPFQLNNTVGLRYYLHHRDQISSGYRGNNLNGSYFEFGTSLDVPFSLNIYENLFLGFGLQSRFLKHGLVDTGMKLQYAGGESALRLSTGFNLGFAFSRDYNLTEMEENKCAIVRCYDEQFYMFKIPVSDLALFSISKNNIEINFRPSLEFEHRISRVGLSMNHEVRGRFEYNGARSTATQSMNYLEASYRMGIKWYVGKKKRIIKGKTSNNLSGFYLGPLGEIGIVGGGTDSIDIVNAEFYSIGYQLGYQTRLLKNLYLNFHFGLLGRNYYNPDVDGVKDMIELRQLSFVIDDPSLNTILEILPIGGLKVGYTF